MSTLSGLAGEQRRAVSLFSTAVATAHCHHAYLLTGRNVKGALALMRAFASTLVCQNRQGVDACGECAQCRKIAAGKHPDVRTLVPDEHGSIGIESVRGLTARLSLCAVESLTKIVLIEHIDRMTTAAQNAFLKTLEEPPGATCFLLFATRPKILLTTVRSRCQRLVVAPARGSGVAESLCAPGVDPEVVNLALTLAEGDGERAQSLMAQGLTDIYTDLASLLSRPTRVNEVLDLAANYGAERDAADLVLAALEVLTRDSLAARLGASAEHIRVFKTTALESDTGALAACAALLAQLRRDNVLHLNRTLAAEHALFCALGLLPDETGYGGRMNRVRRV
jgi:DNA polymerase-3 subunit delta'